MPDFSTEIRKSPREEYVKVFLKNKDKFSDVQAFLSGLPSIRRVNITENSKPDLTVYCARTYSAAETINELTVALNSFFNSRPIDPLIKDETLSTISEKAYRQILEKIYYYGKNLEKYKSLYDKFDEEGFRDFFLPFLNSISETHTATGETFNKIGKTDILIQNTHGENIFIAECKLWKGESELSKAVDQLLQRYVTWRDEKIGLIIFNKNVKGFSEVIGKAVSTLKNHSSFEKYCGKTKDSSFSFVFKHPDDSKRKISLEIILFNCT